MMAKVGEMGLPLENKGIERWEGEGGVRG